MEGEVILKHLFVRIVEDEVTVKHGFVGFVEGEVTPKPVLPLNYLGFTLSVRIPPLLLTHLLLVLALTWQLGALTLTRHMSDSEWEIFNLVLF
jgi:hypothetical protein